MNISEMIEALKKLPPETTIWAFHPVLGAYDLIDEDDLKIDEDGGIYLMNTPYKGES